MYPLTLLATGTGGAGEDFADSGDSDWHSDWHSGGRSDPLHAATGLQAVLAEWHCRS